MQLGMLTTSVSGAVKEAFEEEKSKETSILKVHVELVPRKDLNSTTMSIWSERAKEKGWDVEFSSSRVSRNACDVVVVPTDYHVESLIELMRREKGSDDKIVIVKSQWMFSSLKQNRLLNHIDPAYLIDLRRYPRKVQAPPPMGVSLSPPKPEKKERGFLVKQENLNGVPISETHSNDRLVKHCDKIIEGCVKSNPVDHFRNKNYKIVQGKLKVYGIEIKNSDQLYEFWCQEMLKNGDKKTPDKSSIYCTLCEFLQTGMSKRAYDAQNNPELAADRDLLRIWGAGKKKVDELRSRGINSIEECRDFVEKEKKSWEAKGRTEPFQSGILSQRQLIGLEFADEFNKRIPRDEVAEIEATVVRVVRGLPGGEHAQARAVGSYRRGARSCGDVDILISMNEKCGNDGTELPLLVPLLVWTLMKSGFMTHMLTGFESGWQKIPASDEETSSFMGVCKLPGYNIHRRIDIKQYPRSEFPFALLYFTGSGHFNRSMRSYVGHHGHHRIKGWEGPPGHTFTHGRNSFSLNDKGLYEVYRKWAGAPEHSGTPLNLMPHCRTEKDIFTMLNLPWKEPFERTADIDQGNPLSAVKDSQGLDDHGMPSYRSDDDAYAEIEEMGEVELMASSPKRQRKH